MDPSSWYHQPIHLYTSTHPLSWPWWLNQARLDVRSYSVDGPDYQTIIGMKHSLLSSRLRRVVLLDVMSLGNHLQSSSTPSAFISQSHQVRSLTFPSSLSNSALTISNMSSSETSPRFHELDSSWAKTKAAHLLRLLLLLLFYPLHSLPWSLFVGHHR